MHGKWMKLAQRGAPTVGFGINGHRPSAALIKPISRKYFGSSILLTAELLKPHLFKNLITMSLGAFEKLAKNYF
jgi:hypothetical protein